MKFKDLTIGSTFEFDTSKIDHLMSGIARGPWVKTSSRGYKRISDGMQCTVGTINTKVKLMYPVNEESAT